MGRRGVVVYSRPLRYRYRRVSLPDGTRHSFLTGEEKGIDVRVALDVMALAHRRDHDVALVFSQDQNLSEVAEEIRVIAKEQRRWIKVASAFPHGPATRNRRGINKTDWIRIDRRSTISAWNRQDYRVKRERSVGRSSWWIMGRAGCLLSGSACGRIVPESRWESPANSRHSMAISPLLGEDEQTPSRSNGRKRRSLRGRTIIPVVVPRWWKDPAPGT